MDRKIVEMSSAGPDHIKKNIYIVYAPNNKVNLQGEKIRVTNTL